MSRAMPTALVPRSSAPPTAASPSTPPRSVVAVCRLYITALWTDCDRRPSSNPQHLLTYCSQGQLWHRPAAPGRRGGGGHHCREQRLWRAVLDRRYGTTLGRDRKGGRAPPGHSLILSKRKPPPLARPSTPHWTISLPRSPLRQDLPPVHRWRPLSVCPLPGQERRRRPQVWLRRPVPRPAG